MIESRSTSVSAIAVTGCWLLCGCGARENLARWGKQSARRSGFDQACVGLVSRVRRGRLGVSGALQWVLQGRHESSGHSSFRSLVAPPPSRRVAARTFDLSEPGETGCRKSTIVAGWRMARSPSENAWRRRWDKTTAVATARCVRQLCRFMAIYLCGLRGGSCARRAGREVVVTEAFRVGCWE
jgi:hypothetical protein